MHSKNRLFHCIMLLIAMLAGVADGYAQNAFDLISRHRHISASNFSIYPDSVEQPMTPPPTGKHAFYISHYGRHGSRYLSNRKAYDLPYLTLSRADSLDELTPIGQDVLKELRNIIADAEDQWGDLTGIGKKQQRDIASRMMKNFPEVFSDTAFIDAHSTIVNRCILSMGSAVLQMVSENPQLRVSMSNTYRDMWYMNHQDKQLRDSMMTHQARQAFKAFAKPRDYNPRLMELLFVDSAYVEKEVDQIEFNYYLLKTALMQQNTRMSHYKSILLDLFSYEDIHQFWQKENAWWYICYGATPLNGGCQPYSQRYLLRQIIADADSIIRQDTRGATLRYGHETVVLPLTCLLGVNGFDLETDRLDELEEKGWWACLVFPMASNLQFVFYRENVHDDDVVFKLLLNEKEAALPIPTDIAPYYHWRDFREYYLRKLDAYDKKTKD